MSLRMTESQDIASEGIINFLNTPIRSDDIRTKVLVLTGKAGTGKTWLIQNVLKPYFASDNRLKGTNNMDGLFTPNVMGVAFTHKAKSVLGEKIPLVTTFAKFYGLKEQYEKDGEVFFSRSKKQLYKSPSSYPIKVIAHDECSMHSDNMKTIAEKYTHRSSKIIYIGDPGQLPPVQKNELNEDKDSLTFIASPNRFHLNERVRQTEGNPIIDLSDIVYEEIFNEKNVVNVLNNINKSKLSGDKGYQVLTKEEAVRKYLNCSSNYMDSKFITYRNNTLKSWNRSVRNNIYGHIDDVFIEGELIYMNKTYRDPNEEFNLYNSSEYHITGYENSYVKVNNHEIKEIECYMVYVDKEEVEDCTPNAVPAIPILKPTSWKTYQRILKDKHEIALNNNDSKSRGRYWKDYYQFQESFGNISFGYAFTGHKAQGSGYKNIFLDVGDILSVPVTNKRKLQSLYTGITRASNNLYLIQ